MNQNLTYDDGSWGLESDFVIHKTEDFEGMRRAGRLAAEVLDYITDFVKPGITTAGLDKLCHEFILDNKAIPATVGYKGYRHASCISLNHVVCHGIPDDRVLVDSDMMNIDITVILDGWYGDSSRMYCAGDKVPVKAKLLIDTTYECLMRGIEVVKPGATLGDIGHAIQQHAEAKRYSVVRDFCGHGIGKKFHTPPSVLHYGEPGHGPVLKAGMFFTIEPMINTGSWQTKILSDGWTAVTKDRSFSAQFEHTLGVTETGYEIFTLSPRGFTKPPYV